ncbi:MAG: universal stress protein [Burkholderiales bacterium]|nr:universal stress protein [Burkholderiales bacterium]
MAATGSPRLLLATEHTEQDQGAERLAFDLARRAGAPLAAVLPVAFNAEFESAAPELAARADAEVASRRLALEAAAGGAGVELDLAVRRGAELYAEIVEEARERASDCIVIRHRGKRSLLANLLMGEMVAKVVAHAPCSVLVVPREAALWRRGVLLGLDPQQPDLTALGRALGLAGDFAVPLHVVSVAPHAHAQARSDAERVLQHALAQAATSRPGVPTGGEVRVGTVHAELIAAAGAQGADLLVIGRHGGGAIARAWIGGVAQKVIGLATCPVLVHVPPSSTTQR